MENFNSIGRPKPLLDGKEKVTGALRYVPDLALPGTLHLRFVTSPYAHARIDNIDTTAALALPGVTAVLTAADLPDIPPTTRNRLLLARGRTLFAGQPVALVVAESPTAAQDAVDQVWVEYEPLPAAVTLDEALAADAPLVWPGGAPGESGEAAAHGADVGGESQEKRPSNVTRQSDFRRGDVEEGFAAADVVVEHTFTTAMVHQNYLETHAVLIQPDPLTGGATVWSSTQAPFYVREQVAEVLGVAETAVRVVATTPGGAFGGKFLLYELLVALVARKFGRPVRLALTRGEDLLATTPAPAARLHLKLGARKDGTLTALAADLTFDVGCYPSAHAIGAFMLGSLYRIANFDLHYTEVMTFKLSAAAYRAPAMPQVTFALESLIDEAARKLQLDPLALRLQNCIRSGDLLANEKPAPTIGMEQVLERLQAHPAWQNRHNARAAGRGVGVAVGGWPGGVEPAAASCELHRDGTLQVKVSSADLTGTPTGFALIAAEAFGIDPQKVGVVRGGTTMAYSGAAGGSKITYTVGSAVLKAAQEARVQTLEIAAQEFEADVADLEMVADQVRVKGVPDRAMTLSDIAKMTMRFGGKYAPVVGNGRHADPDSAPTYCAQLAEVEVDEETGEVRVQRLVLVQDVGRAINPLAIRGQMAGGAMQGVGWALYEQMHHDEQGQLLTGSWLDYAVPHFEDAVPQMDLVIVEVPSERGPFGARGVGEPPVIATAAAVANAIADGSRARLTSLPMTPPRVLDALQNSQ